MEIIDLEDSRKKLKFMHSQIIGKIHLHIRAYSPESYLINLEFFLNKNKIIFDHVKEFKLKLTCKIIFFYYVYPYNINL